MSLVDKPFKEAIRGLPTRKLSWWADRRIKKMLRYRAAELDGKTVWADFFKQLVAVPMAFVVLFTAVGSYGYASPSVVKGDLLYFVKTTIENARYPQDGSSEDRIAYHLWLSERRYDEVNEILSRLGKAPLVFIPVARAVESTGSTDDVLNQILLETLQNATQQVDYAFLISDEIRDVERVKTVQQQIRSSLEKQREFVKQVTPVLKEVKLQQKKKARVKKVKPVPVLEEPALETVEEASPDSSSLIPDPVQIPDAALVSEDVQVEVENEQIDQNVQLDELEIALEPVAVVEEENEVEDVGGFLEDRVEFQNALLQQIDEAVAQANTSGMTVVRLSVFVKPLRDGEEEISNEFFTRALSSHYQHSRKILESELQEFVGEVSSPESDVSEESVVENMNALEEPQGLVPNVPVRNDSIDRPKSPDEDAVLEVDTDVDARSDGEPVVNIPEEKNIPAEVIDEKESVVLPLESEVVPVSDEPTLVSPVPNSDPSDSPEVKSEPLKTECEIKSEEFCLRSEQSGCVQEAVKKCEAEERERLDRERLQQEILEKTEEMKQQIQEIDQKMDQLKIDTQNIAPKTINTSNDVNASILKDENRTVPEQNKNVDLPKNDASNASQKDKKK